MSENGDDGPKYSFTTENNEIKHTSRGYAGRAIANYPNGDIYDGYFVEGVREGRGTYYYASNGEKYDGEWLKNLKHGIGKMTYAKTGEYNGFWENGRRHGEGIFTYTNGDVYSGWWKFGEKEGTGTYTFKSTGMKLAGDTSTGMKLYGEWSSGQLVSGKWIYPNGMYYEGAFENNKPKGDGKWVFKNGNVLNGTYTQKPKEVGEDEEPEPAEEEEGENVVKKPKVTLEWQSHTNITEAAHKVNSVEQ